MIAAGLPVAATRRRSALLLLAGDGLSAFGMGIDFLAILSLAAYPFQVSAWQMAVVSAAGLLPGMVAGPSIGRTMPGFELRQVGLAVASGECVM